MLNLWLFYARGLDYHSPVPLSPDARNSCALAILRIGVGLFFLIFAQYKILSTQFTLHGGFQFWINKFLTEGGAYPFMVSILRNFVLPHATPIAFLVAYGELAIGLALLLGVFVRPASVAGLIYMLTLLFASDYPGLLRPPLAILRRQPESLCLRFVLCDVFARRRRIDLVASRRQKIGPRYRVLRAGRNHRLQHVMAGWAAALSSRPRGDSPTYR